MPLHLSKLIAIATVGLSASYSMAQSEEIPDYCADIDSDLCKAYIHGFLDGAVITDTALINNIVEGEKDRSDFVQRAFSTRVGQERFNRNPTFYADFCLPEGVSLEQDAATIASDLSEDHTGDNLAVSVYGVIKQDFPCIE